MDFPSKFGRNASESTGFLFMRAYNHWHTRVKQALQGIDLTHPQFVVLTAVGYLSQSSEEVFQVTIANFSDMDVMTVSQVLKLLEKKALIWRTVAKMIHVQKQFHSLTLVRRNLKSHFRLLKILIQSFFSNVSELKQFQHALQELTKEDD